MPTQQRSQSVLEPEPEPERGDGETRRKVVDVVDLSSSPPVVARAHKHAARSQAATTAAASIPKYKGSSKIHTFFNSSKSTLPDQSKGTGEMSEAGMGMGIGMPASKEKEKGKEKENEQRKKKKKIITLRASLAGAWKEVSEDEADAVEREEEMGGKGTEGKGVGVARVRREGRWRMSQVEVLDLTGGD